MQTTKAPKLKTKRSKISYAKWGYIFIAPFFLAYALFHFAPQLLTIYNSFFENYREGLTQVGPNFVGLKNYITLFTPDKNGTIDILKYAGNTIVLWVCGAIPQVVISLMLACFFTSYRLKIKGQQFFKTVIYMPNLIMASAFAMLFYMLFSNVGPINQILTQLGWIDAPIDFFNIRFTVRGLICLMNFLMWFGNTTILLMAGIMGIDQSLFEAANIDGCGYWKSFFLIMLPIAKPGVVVAAVFSFVYAWGDLIYGITFITNPNMRPITSSIYNYVQQYQTLWNSTMAFGIIAISPVVLIFIFMQRYIVSGLTNGAVKA